MSRMVLRRQNGSSSAGVSGGDGLAGKGMVFPHSLRLRAGAPPGPATGMVRGRRDSLTPIYPAPAWPKQAGRRDAGAFGTVNKAAGPDFPLESVHLAPSGAWLP